MNIEKNYIVSGIYAGILSGIIFGALMGMMDMLPMVAKLMGGSAAFGGFLLHIVFSVIIGILFALFFGHSSLNTRDSMAWGILYGVIWWILGPLVIMPVWLGMGLQLSATGIAMALPSFWGHLVFGAILGFSFPLFASAKEDR